MLYLDVASSLAQDLLPFYYVLPSATNTVLCGLRTSRFNTAFYAFHDASEDSSSESEQPRSSPYCGADCVYL